jgi:hypothetical protein
MNIRYNLAINLVQNVRNILHTVLWYLLQENGDRLLLEDGNIIGIEG